MSEPIRLDITGMTQPTDALLFVSYATYPEPTVYDLARNMPATVETDRDRAILRALLKLALQRLDAQEQPTRRVQLG